MRLSAAALLGTRRVLARQGWAGEKSGLFEQPAGVVRSVDQRNGKLSLAADNEKVARSNRWAGKAILRLQGLERDAKPLGYFSERVAYADFIPVRGPGGGKLSFGRKWGEFVGRDLVKFLLHFFFCSHRNLQVVGLVAGRGGVSPELRV